MLWGLHVYCGNSLPQSVGASSLFTWPSSQKRKPVKAVIYSETMHGSRSIQKLRDIRKRG